MAKFSLPAFSATLLQAATGYERGLPMGEEIARQRRDDDLRRQMLVQGANRDQQQFEYGQQRDRQHDAHQHYEDLLTLHQHGLIGPEALQGAASAAGLPAGMKFTDPAAMAPYDTALSSRLQMLPQYSGPQREQVVNEIQAIQEGKPRNTPFPQLRAPQNVNFPQIGVLPGVGADLRLPMPVSAVAPEAEVSREERAGIIARKNKLLNDSDLAGRDIPDSPLKEALLAAQQGAPMSLRSRADLTGAQSWLDTLGQTLSRVQSFRAQQAEVKAKESAAALGEKRQKAAGDFSLKMGSQKTPQGALDAMDAAGRELGQPLYPEFDPKPQSVTDDNGVEERLETPEEVRARRLSEAAKRLPPEKNDLRDKMALESVRALLATVKSGRLKGKSLASLLTKLNGVADAHGVGLNLKPEDFQFEGMTEAQRAQINAGLAGRLETHRHNLEEERQGRARILHEANKKSGSWDAETKARHSLMVKEWEALQSEAKTLEAQRYLRSEKKERLDALQGSEDEPGLIKQKFQEIQEFIKNPAGAPQQKAGANSGYPDRTATVPPERARQHLYAAQQRAKQLYQAGKRPSPTLSPEEQNAILNAAKQGIFGQ